LLAGVEVEVHEFAVVAGGVAQGHVQHPLAPLDEVGVQHFAVDLYGGAVAQGGDGGDVRAVFVAQRQVGKQIAQGFHAAAGEEFGGFVAVAGDGGEWLVEGHGTGLAGRRRYCATAGVWLHLVPCAARAVNRIYTPNLRRSAGSKSGGSSAR